MIVHVVDFLRLEEGGVQDGRNLTVSSATAAVTVRADTAPIRNVRSIVFSRDLGAAAALRQYGTNFFGCLQWSDGRLLRLALRDVNAHRCELLHTTHLISG